jgi:hypothetical protein
MSEEKARKEWISREVHAKRDVRMTVGKSRGNEGEER